MLCKIKHFLKRERSIIMLFILCICIACINFKFFVISLFNFQLDVIFTLATFIMIAHGMELSGVFERISWSILARISSSRLLITSILLLSAFTASLVMNDSAVFIFVPLVSSIAKKAKINASRFIALLLAAINIGSALTPNGNPQNIIVWHTSEVSYIDFVLYMSQFVIILLCINVLVGILTMPRRKISIIRPPSIQLNRQLAGVSIFLLPTCIILVQLGFAWLALLITTISYLIVERTIIVHFNLGLILFFILMILDFGMIALIMAPFIGSIFCPITGIVIASMITTNVPAALLFLSSYSWQLIAIGSNIGGLAPTGSMANFIGLKLIKVDTREYIKITTLILIMCLIPTILLYGC